MEELRSGTSLWAGVGEQTGGGTGMCDARTPERPQPPRGAALGLTGARAPLCSLQDSPFSRQVFCVTPSVCLTVQSCLTVESIAHLSTPWPNRVRSVPCQCYGNLTETTVVKDTQIPEGTRSGLTVANM